MLTAAFQNPLDYVDTWALVVLFLLLMGLFILIIVLFAWNRRRIRKLQFEGLPEPPERGENEVKRVEGIERVLASQGYDTTEAKMHITSARRFLKRGDKISAITEAGIAKKVLIKIKAEKPPQNKKVVDLLSLPEPAEDEEEEDLGFNVNKEIKEKMPKMYLESKFAINAARAMLDDIASDLDRDVAQKSLNIAQSLFDDEDYEEAFSQACKARRLAGISGIKLKDDSEKPCFDEYMEPLDEDEADDDRNDDGDVAETSKEIERTLDSSNKIDSKDVLEKKHGEKCTEHSKDGEENLEDESRISMDDDETESADLEEAGLSCGNCPKCNETVNDNDRFCRNCGEKQNVHCSKCNKRGSPGDRFCRNCGEELG